jgi:hypothetical protein
MAEQHGGWAARPPGAEEIPLVGAFGIQHMPQPDPPPVTPRHIKGLPDPEPPEPGEERGHWEPV